ncbi:hypothetical protein KEM54_003377 [Ascosphaera aggregata]|nr:hypothetical protein KEM54_003377 [Ascosphaera aggregata]
MRARKDNEPYLSAAKHRIDRLARNLPSSQITHDGPVFMVQLENEYGADVTNVGNEATRTCVLLTFHTASVTCSLEFGLKVVLSSWVNGPDVIDSRATLTLIGNGIFAPVLSVFWVWISLAFIGTLSLTVPVAPVEQSHNWGRSKCRIFFSPLPTKRSSRAKIILVIPDDVL